VIVYSILSLNQEEEITFKSYASLSATLQDKKVKRVTYSCTSKNRSDHTSLNGISCGDQGEKILARFNGDVQVLCPIKSEQEGTRIYVVVKYGTRYYLTFNSVTHMQIASPETLKSDRDDQDWDKCQ